jgi:hypothetical protein
VIACAPPAAWFTVVVIVVRASEGAKTAAEMTAMETMASAEAMTAAAKAAAVTTATN